MNLNTIDWKRYLGLFLGDVVQSRVVVAVQLLLLALLAIALAGLTWRLLPAGEQQMAASTPQAVAAAQAQGTRSWNLAQWHLFGIKPQGSVQASLESLPETSLNLILRGVVAAGGSNVGGGAIIGAPSGTDSFYAVDAALPGGATLREVYGDRVVLERNGRLETLRLPREGLEGAIPSAPDGASSLPQAAASGDERTFSEYRQIAMTNPQQLSEMMQVQPKTQNGRVLGYEVQPGRDPGLFNRLGLAPGDVVTSVNGVGLDNPARALGALRSLSGQEAVSIELQRNGVSQTLQINLRD
ncbi:MAG: type II secretion system protein GspC [Chromatiales bacterium]|jgi:general secretion pathway protein C|nr:type II secretion system protein GspC [Chromatiales bacterium]